MKQNFKSLVSGILIGSVLTGGITLAKTGSETLEAWYSDIKIYVNGAAITPKDANGNIVEPFIVNGTTYLPIRAIGEALGKDVSWDGTTNSVYLTDQKLPTEPVETPAPSPTPTLKPTPSPTAIPTAKPSEFSYTTAEILQISGYQQEDIKGEISLAWDSNQPNAAFHAKMRCNNGGLADYVDCEISLVETISCSENGFTGYFKIVLSDTVKYAKLKGTVTVDNGKISLHTEEYDYRLVAAVSQTHASSQWEMATFFGLQAISYNGEKANGLLGLEMNEEKSDLTLTGTFTVGEDEYTVRLEEVTSVSNHQINGVFSVLCNERVHVTQVSGTIGDLSAPLGDVMNLTIEGFTTLKLRVVEIAY